MNQLLVHTRGANYVLKGNPQLTHHELLKRERASSWAPFQYFQKFYDLNPKSEE